MTSIPTPSGVWTLRLGGISLLLHRRSWLMFTLLVLVLLGLTVLATSLGSGHLGVPDVIATLTGNGSRLQEIMLFKIRLPRVAAAIIAGLAMGMAGCLIQTLVRNRLATPDMIGVNEGASLAVVVFALYLTLGNWPWWASPLGAALAAAALFALCRRPGEQGYLFIVIGIALSELLGALGDFAMSTQPLAHLGSIYLWTMGHFAGVSYQTVKPVAMLLLLLCPLMALVNRPRGTAGAVRPPSASGLVQPVERGRRPPGRTRPRGDAARRDLATQRRLALGWPGATGLARHDPGAEHRPDPARRTHERAGHRPPGRGDGSRAPDRRGRAHGADRDP